MPAAYATELERLLEQACELLGAGDDALLADANIVVNHALRLTPDCVDAWLIKAQIASAQGDDLAALALVEMALLRGPDRLEAMYWRGAVLGDLGYHREALRSIDLALRAIGDGDHWLLEDLFFEKVSILEALGLHDAAVTACEAGLDRCPGSPLLRAALAPAERSRVRGSLKVLRGGAG
jgi:tetratricopeptide (TPR) repeat protein